MMSFFRSYFRLYTISFAPHERSELTKLTPAQKDAVSIRARTVRYGCACRQLDTLRYRYGCAFGWLDTLRFRFLDVVELTKISPDLDLQSKNPKPEGRVQSEA